MVKVMVSMGMWITRFARGRLAVVVPNFVVVVVVVFIYPIVVVRQLCAVGEKRVVQVSSKFVQGAKARKTSETRAKDFAVARSVGPVKPEYAPHQGLQLPN